MRGIDLLGSLNLPCSDQFAIPSSTTRFPDGGQYRVEIPSVEGPEVLDAVLSEADSRGVSIHRVSQGSGSALLGRDELEHMARIGRERCIEVSIFARPQANWSPGAGGHLDNSPFAQQMRGMNQIAAGLDEIARIADAGIRSTLLTDLGLLWAVNRLRERGRLPSTMQFKGSVQMGLLNPLAIRVAADMGLDTYNVPPDMALGELARVRELTDMPIDLYIEAPDSLGGFVRSYEIAEIVRVAAPVYVKFGLRNAPDIYPSGGHLGALPAQLGVERVRRASLALERLQAEYPDAVISPIGADHMAVPELASPPTLEQVV